MKLHFRLFIAFLFLANWTFAQEAEKEKSIFQSYPELKIYGGIPVGIGDSFISKGHNPQFDFGFYISPFSLYNVNFGIGFDYARFNVSEASLAGNGTHSSIISLYGYFSYPLLVSRKIDFEPKLGVGGTGIQQKRNDKNFGKMDGVIFNIGANFEYELAHPLEIFIGTDYFYSKFDVNANEEYKSFFENVSRVNVFVGVKFNFRKKKSPEENSEN